MGNILNIKYTLLYKKINNLKKKKLYYNFYRLKFLSPYNYYYML